MKNDIIFWNIKKQTIADLEIANCESTSDLDALLFKNRTAVVVADLPLILKHDSELHQFVLLREKFPEHSLILVADELTSMDKKFLVAYNSLHPFRFVFANDDHQLHGAILSGIERARTLQQDRDFKILLESQSTDLEQSTKSLEERVEVRTRALTESREQIYRVSHRMQSLKDVLLRLQGALQTSEIESVLNDSLSRTFDILWVKICSENQIADFERELKNDPFVFLSQPLHRANLVEGKIYFMRGPDSSFSRDDKKLFTQIADAVSLALDRIEKLENSQRIKFQWEQTFDAIQAPLLIIDEDYNIELSNKAATQYRPQVDHSKKCYKVLFGRQTPCEQCQRGKAFELRNQSLEFEVSSQKTLTLDGRRGVYVNMYRDVSGLRRMERRLLSSTQESELGVISGSIAHELNNPLGGMLTITQLALMDSTEDSEVKADLIEIEKGIQRSKKIVDELLVFARIPYQTEQNQGDLSEVIEQSISLVRLRSKSTGLEISATPINRGQILIRQPILYMQCLQSVLSILLECQSTAGEKINLTLKVNTSNQGGYSILCGTPSAIQKMHQSSSKLTGQQNFDAEKIVQLSSRMNLDFVQAFIKDLGGSLVWVEENNTISGASLHFFT